MKGREKKALFRKNIFYFRMFETFGNLEIDFSIIFNKCFWTVINKNFIKTMRIYIKYRNFGRNLLGKHFKHLKLYSTPQKWLAKNCCHMGTFERQKIKRLKSTFLTGSIIQVLPRGSSPPKKTYTCENRYFYLI